MELISKRWWDKRLIRCKNSMTLNPKVRQKIPRCWFSWYHRYRLKNFCLLGRYNRSKFMRLRSTIKGNKWWGTYLFYVYPIFIWFSSSFKMTICLEFGMFFLRFKRVRNFIRSPRSWTPIYFMWLFINALREAYTSICS